MRQHATFKIERTALTISAIKIDELQFVVTIARHDGAADGSFMFIKSLGSANAIWIYGRSGYIVGEICRNIRSLIRGHRGKVAIFAKCVVGAYIFVARWIIHFSLLTIHDG